jgi:hypothetical protein
MLYPAIPAINKPSFTVLITVLNQSCFYFKKLRAFSIEQLFKIFSRINLRTSPNYFSLEKIDRNSSMVCSTSLID